MIYFSSDYHFNHNKEFIYRPRGFDSIEEMNEMIIQNHNAIVRPEDDIYILGDLMLGGGTSEALTSGLVLVSRLNGRIHLIRGNHDTTNRWSIYSNSSNIVELNNSLYLDYAKYHFYLSHYPSITSNNDYDKPLKARLLNLCGHTHTKDKWLDCNKGYIYHVELDAHNNYPIPIDKVLSDFHNLPNEPIVPRCDKCVHLEAYCGHSDKDGKCPEYKRDPPDGGYYG